jgi:hypothetical protein
MIAIQRINAAPQKSVFGIVSNGDIWEMGMLAADVFTKFESVYPLKSLDELYNALCNILAHCKAQQEAD